MKISNAARLMFWVAIIVRDQDFWCGLILTGSVERHA